ncbi:MAG: lysylphosphatidylglycerol synthase domain-containing protein [Nocardioides sp.]
MTEGEPGAPASRRSRALRTVVVLVLVAGLGYALVTQLGGVRKHLGDLSVPNVVGAQLALVCGLATGLLAWRALLADLGSPLPATVGARIFYVGQLGKYLPGSVWPVVTQMQLGAQANVPRRRSAAAALVALLLSVLAGLLVAAACAPALWSRLGALTGTLGLVVLALGLVACHPRLLNRLLALGMRLLRQPPLEHPLSGRGIATAVGLSALTWVFNGIQAWLLVVDVGGAPLRSLPYAVGGFALAAASGPLLVVLPAGAGVREAGLVVALSPVLTTAAATTVALVSRLLFTVADAGAAGVAALTARRAQVRQPVDLP